MTEALEKKILVVDDDNVFRSRLAKAFTARGYDSLEAENLSEAQVQIKNEEIDYAVFDLALPDGSGLDLVKEFTDSQPESKSVILTGYGTIATAVQAIKDGAVQYLAKPTNADAILAALTSSNEIGSQADEPTPTLSQVEWEHMNRVLDDNDGNITKTAKALGLHRRSLQRKLAKKPNLLK